MDKLLLLTYNRFIGYAKLINISLVNEKEAAFRHLFNSVCCVREYAKIFFEGKQRDANADAAT